MIEPDLYPHQEKAVGELSNGNILKGGVGSGKTRTALAYYCRLAPWVKLYVITTAKKRDSCDWEEEAKLFGVDVVVDSWNNLMAYVDVKEAFFIFDEQRVVGSGVWVQAFITVAKNNSWILLSATPGDTWLDYIPVFIANGFYKNRTEFLRRHVQFNTFLKFPKVERYIETWHLVDLLRSITVEMPFERHTVRHSVDVHVDYDRELFDSVWKRRWNYLEQRPVRHVSELFSLARRVVGTDESRFQRIQDLLVEHPRIIVFYNFDYELDLLRRLREDEIWMPETSSQQSENGKTGENSGQNTATAEERGSTSVIQNVLGSFAVAEWNGHKHEPIPETDSWVYLVQYVAGAEGWNCTTTDTVVFYSLNYSYKVWEQAHGRIDRVNTPFTDLYYYILRSSSPVDVGVYKALSGKRDFSERKFIGKGSGVLGICSHDKSP